MLIIAMTLATAEPLKPTGRWVVNFAENACVLSRQYGEGKQGFSLHFKAPLIGESYEIMIARPERRSHGWTMDRGWIEKPDGRRIEPIYISEYSTVDDHRLSRIRFDPELYTLGEDGDRLILHLDKRHHYDLALPAFEKARAVLGTCLTDLRKVHGVDEQVMAGIATPAKADKPLYRYFSTDDYPSEAVREGQQGSVGILYWIETDGRVKQCKIIESSGRDALDRQTCAIIVDSARFTPALDASGSPIRSPDFTRISWVMP